MTPVSSIYCEHCRWGNCYIPPAAHVWFDQTDVQAARSKGHPDPTGLCGCPCAQEET